MDRDPGPRIDTLVGRATGRRGRSCLLAALALGLLAARLVAGAQQPARIPRIGYLSPVERGVDSPLVDAFRQGLRELGHVEGQNVAMEYRWAAGSPERLRDLAAELVGLRVEVIVTGPQLAPHAAKNATTSIPIVFAVASDPVEEGLVASLARPGGNVTGLAITAGPEIFGKHLELLKEAVPRISRVGVLRNPDNLAHPLILRQGEGAARALGLQLQILGARGPTEIDAAIAAMTSQRAGGILVLRDPVFYSHRARIAALAAKGRLPAVYGLREHADAGGLMAYGANVADLYRRAATYVDKILKGTKPAELPVEQPMRFELVINMKTAKALGITFPQSILIRADQAIH